LDSNLKNKKLFVEGAMFSSEPTKLKNGRDWRTCHKRKKSNETAIKQNIVKIVRSQANLEFDRLQFTPHQFLKRSWFQNSS
jgi:hypothetical protein